jgi:hypothetical protein
MRYIVLYAESCRACSDVAQMVRDASVPELEARGFADAEVAALVPEVPERPTLLVVSETGAVRSYHGWAMRRRLAAVVGWRRSGTIVRLLAAEWRARLFKASEAPTRRRMLGGALAGAAALVISIGAGKVASADSGKQTPVAQPEPAEPHIAAQVLAGTTAARAVRAFGPADPQVHVLDSDVRAAYVLYHPSTGVQTYIDRTPSDAAEPVGVSISRPSADVMRFHTVDGQALADMNLATGMVTPALAEPDKVFTPAQIKCFAGCVGRNVTANCLQNCYTCGSGGGSAPVVAAACAICAVCAGPYAITCYYECF